MNRRQEFYQLKDINKYRGSKRIILIPSRPSGTSNCVSQDDISKQPTAPIPASGIPTNNPTLLSNENDMRTAEIKLSHTADNSAGTPTSLRKNIMLYLSITFAILILGIIPLCAFGIFPQQFILIFTSYAAIFAVVAAIWSEFRAFVNRIWQQATHPALIVGLGIVTVAVLILGPPIFLSAEALHTKNPSRPTVPPYINQPTTDDNTSGNTYLINQPVPVCPPTRGAIWRSTFPQTIRIRCKSNGLEITEVSPLHYAELGLEQSMDRPCNLASLQVGVSIMFPNPNDPNTWAGIFIHIPGRGLGHMDTKYVLELNALGQWRLGEESGNVITHKSGVIPIDPAAYTTLKIEVQKGALILEIHGYLLISLGICDKGQLSIDLLGFRVETNASVSSPVLFSDFKLG